ncbi:alpha/beta fold hydrolase [Tsukamurella sp. 8F]|uniref:alpha/beta hydrolase n=1 Tax=unclassified Tsukamurella TaxID=2633480 RepID=UPI0023BA3223|nr:MULTISPECIES: alpha/beta fold hydrolase [unclassified Tsukamurella]MDF0530581.1 alpha/beta fold hydrolase [Tsukamurella sp. 8J]MDF0586769.1 alpha/beta fold hydrolase [Tsukamurella sp. 8F]
MPPKPVLDWRPDAAVGYHHFHPDRSLNFQCNRWVQWIGPEAIDDVAAVARSATEYSQWIDGFLAAAGQARSEGRRLAGAYYDRAAEFFMLPTDPRRRPTRERFVGDMRELFEVQPEGVPYSGGTLPAYDLTPAGPVIDTVLVFGGFDSYIEEFLPLATAISDAGYRVIAFDGPGQGGALEDHGIAMTPAWERPVGAVLDHFGIDHGVTAIGVSLGGGLVIRAAAFDPRVRRVVAFDVADDELDLVARQIAPGAGPVLRTLLAVRAHRLIDLAARRAAARRPVSQWGLWQGMHITGTRTPHEFLRAAAATHTRDVSGRVSADVLLLAGANDHYIPLGQLERQAANLTAARSVTTRVFTAADQAGNHCQIGNVGLAVRVALGWLDTVRAAAR